MEVEHAPARKDPASSWLREAITAFLSEARLFLSTLSFALRPRRFVDAWLEGERRVMNPLGFMATALGIAAVLAEVSASLAGARPGAAADHSVITELLQAFGPYLHYVALGLICHGLLVALGSRRSLFGSVAIALYAGGAATLQAALMFGLESAWGAAHHLSFEKLAATPTGLAALVATVTLSLLIFAIPFVRGLSALHQVGSGRCMGALVLAFLATGFLFGLLSPPGNYGLHLVVRFTRHTFGINLAMS